MGSLIARGIVAAFKIINKESPKLKRSLEFFDTNNTFDIAKVKNMLRFYPGINLKWIKIQ